MTDNSTRVNAAAEALSHYAKVKRDMEWEDDMSRLADLLTDLMHFCKRNADREDCPMDFDSALTTAQVNFDAEQ